MSKDMLGPAFRAAVNIPQDHLDAYAKIGSKLALEEPKARPEGEVWNTYLKKILQDGIPAWAYLLDVKVNQVELGEFPIDHEWSLQGLLQGQKGRSTIGSGLDFLHRFRQLSPGTFAPAPRRGIIRYKVSAVRFGRALPRSALQYWADQNKKIMAGSKEGIIIALALSPLKFAKVLPLAMTGEIVYDHQDYSYAAKFFEDNGCLTLDVLRFDEHHNGPLFSPQWHFLMLEEIPQPA